MNIFVLDKNPFKAAQYHCDKHVVKMVLEATQTLSTVLWRYGVQARYNPTHVNHPCVVWAGESKENFLWTLSYGFALCEQYTLRYGKTHKCLMVLNEIKPYAKILPFKRESLTVFVQAMPEKYKNKDVVKAYRNYYKGEKYFFAKWNYSQTPFWWS